MPLHLDSFVKREQQDAVTAAMLQSFNESNAIVVSFDKKFFHLQKPIIDTLTNSTIGKLVFTLYVNEEEQGNEILDLDVVLQGDSASHIEFLSLQPGSSDANEYYEAMTIDSEAHFELETVNRYAEHGELTGTQRVVRVSVFPFQVNVFENLSQFNRWVGFGDDVRVGSTDIMVNGLSDTFIMPSGIMNSTADNVESYSFVVGTLLSYRNVVAQFGDINVSFIIATVHTAIGDVPVALSRENFDLSQLREGCIIAMNADVKADIAQDSDIHYI